MAIRKPTLMVVRDRLHATSPGSAPFRTLRSAGFGEVLRGVSFTPHTQTRRDQDDDDGER